MNWSTLLATSATLSTLLISLIRSATLKFFLACTFLSFNASFSSYHIARKTIPYYDEATDSTIKPTVNNGIKLESFIFDVFPSAERISACIKGRNEFTPIKNAPGMFLLYFVDFCALGSKVDTPEIALEILLKSEREWLKKAGAIVEEEGVYEVCFFCFWL